MSYAAHRRSGRPNHRTVVYQMLIGSGSELPHKCSTCNRGFALKKYVDVHEKIHSRKKPYKCTECTKSFTQSGQLRTHSLIHSNKKPFKCPVCDQRFRHSNRICSIHKLKAVKVDTTNTKKMGIINDENKEPGKIDVNKVLTKPFTTQEPVVDSGQEAEENAAKQKNEDDGMMAVEEPLRMSDDGDSDRVCNIHKLKTVREGSVDTNKEPIDIDENKEPDKIDTNKVAFKPSASQEPVVDPGQEDEKNAAMSKDEDYRRMEAVKGLLLLRNGHDSKEM
ncbi:protein bowel-like isoform X3 [Parasteatoda tepidariorum]|uniref:protein bowel-like isoform X3 n=1 Tax=Parasteatoda tepidariorum TaxID=114398 RepID=UPI00077FAAB4